MPAPKNLLDLVRSGMKLSGLDRKVFKSASLLHAANERWLKASRKAHMPHALGDFSLEKYDDDAYGLTERLGERFGMGHEDYSGMFHEKAGANIRKCSDKYGSSTPEYRKCIGKFFTEIYPESMPTEDMVRADPISYVDHVNGYVRDFARRLVNGEY